MPIYKLLHNIIFAYYGGDKLLILTYTGTHYVKASLILHQEVILYGKNISEKYVILRGLKEAPPLWRG